MDSNDWLDQRLAASETYTPDDGFTSNVMEHLPKKTMAHAVRVRRLVLAVAGVIAFCLFAALLVPTLHALSPVLAHYASPGSVNRVFALFSNPFVMGGVSAGVLALFFFGQPLLRRVA